jgi:hypothetical protein
MSRRICTPTSVPQVAHSVQLDHTGGATSNATTVHLTARSANVPSFDIGSFTVDDQVLLRNYCTLVCLPMPTMLTQAIDLLSAAKAVRLKLVERPQSVQQRDYCTPFTPLTVSPSISTVTSTLTGNVHGYATHSSIQPFTSQQITMFYGRSSQDTVSSIQHVDTFKRCCDHRVNLTIPTTILLFNDTLAPGSAARHWHNEHWMGTDDHGWRHVTHATALSEMYTAFIEYFPDTFNILLQLQSISHFATSQLNEYLNRLHSIHEHCTKRGDSFNDRFWLERITEVLPDLRRALFVTHQPQLLTYKAAVEFLRLIAQSQSLSCDSASTTNAHTDLPHCQVPRTDIQHKRHCSVLDSTQPGHSSSTGTSNKKVKQEQLLPRTCFYPGCPAHRWHSHVEADCFVRLRDVAVHMPQSALAASIIAPSPLQYTPGTYWDHKPCTRCRASNHPRKLCYSDHVWNTKQTLLDSPPATRPASPGTDSDSDATTN